MSKNYHCKLGSYEQSIVFQNLVWNVWQKKPSLKKIKIYGDGHVWLYGLPFLTWDRHYHYIDPKDQPIVDYLFLSSVENILRNEYKNREFSNFKKHMLEHRT